MATTPEQVNQNWEAIKRAERSAVEKTRPAGEASTARWLDPVPRNVPAMLEAEKLGKRAAEVGFDWPGADGLVTKLHEEIEELKAEISEGTGPEAIHEELGDLFFTAVNLARHLNIEPEFALRSANAKFRRRFNALEGLAGGREDLQAATSEDLEVLWQQVKDRERSQTHQALFSVAGEE